MSSSIFPGICSPSRCGKAYIQRNHITPGRPTSTRALPLGLISSLPLAFLPVTACDQGGFYSTGNTNSLCTTVYQPAAEAERRFAEKQRLLAQTEADRAAMKAVEKPGPAPPISADADSVPESAASKPAQDSEKPANTGQGTVEATSTDTPVEKETPKDTSVQDDEAAAETKSTAVTDTQVKDAPEAQEKTTSGPPADDSKPTDGQDLSTKPVTEVMSSEEKPSMDLGTMLPTASEAGAAEDAGKKEAAVAQVPDGKEKAPDGAEVTAASRQLEGDELPVELMTLPSQLAEDDEPQLAVSELAGVPEEYGMADVAIMTEQPQLPAMDDSEGLSNPDALASGDQAQSDADEQEASTSRERLRAVQDMTAQAWQSLE